MLMEINLQIPSNFEMLIFIFRVYQIIQVCQENTPIRGGIF